MTEIKPVVLEFISDHPEENSKHYYIGRSKEDILANTNDGKRDYLAKFSSYKEIPIKKAEKLNLGFYRQGYESILKGSKSFKLKTPDDLR